MFLESERLTYVLAVHVIVEGEAVGGVVVVVVFGVHVEGGGQEAGLIAILPRSRCLDVHVITCST